MNGSHDPTRAMLLSVARDQSPVAERKCHALFALIDTCRSLDHGLRRELARNHLTENGFGLLAQIASHEPRNLTPGELALCLNLPRQTISTILGRLEISNLIIRERTAADRRVLNLKFTVQGRRVFALALEKYLQAITRAMSALNAGDMARLVETCTRLRLQFGGQPAT
jgi:DNA-binding MarR family transcriptional regulator